jgi:FUN14 domain-containing protein 1
MPPLHHEQLKLLLQFAQHYGYITINWNRLNGDVERARKEIQKKAEKDLPRYLDQLQKFALENVLLAGGFAGGFFLGLASS